MRAKRRLRSSTGLRDADLPDRCVTDRKLTLCVGDRVERTVKLPPKEKERLKSNGFWTGTVVSFVMGADNSGRKKMAARVRFDGDRADRQPYKWLFEELKKS